MQFNCKSSSCTLIRHNISGECLARQLHNPRLCELSDPNHKDYSPHYEEYLKQGNLKQEIQKREGTKVVDEMLQNQELLEQINTCKYRSCSCRGAKCSLDPLNIVDVDYHACKDCILEKRRPPEPAPDPSRGFGGKPNLLDRAVSLGKAVINHVASGESLLSDEKTQERLAICQKCEHIEHIPIAGDRCEVCTCFLAAKARMPLEDCPLKKWPISIATSSADSATSIAGSAGPAAPA